MLAVKFDSIAKIKQWVASVRLDYDALVRLYDQHQPDMPLNQFLLLTVLACIDPDGFYTMPIPLPEDIDGRAAAPLVIRELEPDLLAFIRLMEPYKDLLILTTSQVREELETLPDFFLEYFKQTIEEANLYILRRFSAA